MSRTDASTSPPPQPADRPKRSAAIGGVALVILLGVAGIAAYRLLPAPSEPPNALRERAAMLVDADQPAEAKRLIDRVLAVDTPTDRDRLILGIAQKKLGDADTALDTLAAIPDDSPLGPKARYVQGQIERERSRARIAEQHLLHALELDPKLGEARGELIYIYGMQLRRRDLSEQFSKLMEIRPLRFQEVFLWCLSRRVDWDPNSVISILRQYVDADPEDRVSRLSLADALRQATRFDEAVEALEPLSADDGDAIALRARIALDRGDAEEAEALLQTGPDDHPGLARLRGRVALSRRDWTAAARHFRIALDGLPEDRDSLFGLGHSLTQLGQADKAEAYVLKARDQDLLTALVERAANAANRDDPDLVRSLAEACERVGRLAEARAWYKILIDRDPLDQEAQRSLYRLQAAREETGRD